LANAAYASISYLAKAAWPTDLAFFYPYPPRFTILAVTACSLIIAAATAFALFRARSRPWLAVGWLWWIGMLVPVIGIFQVGIQSMADRYTYLPLVGLSIAVAWSVDGILSRSSFGKRACAVLALVAVGGWAVLTRAQTALWKDDLSLFRHAAAVTAPNAIVHQFTGYALAQQEKFDEALAEYRAALAINPHFAEVYDDIGGVLEKQGKLESAIESYRKALEIAPWLNQARLNLANALDAAGRFEEAVPQYEQLIQSGPLMAEAHNTYAIALAQRGRIDEALAHFARASELRPDFVDTYINLGITLVNTGRLDEAVDAVREGLRHQPDSAEARDLLDHLLQDQKRASSTPR
jgi:Tfp pilus assembly protein PilF